MFTCWLAFFPCHYLSYFCRHCIDCVMFTYLFFSPFVYLFLFLFCCCFKLYFSFSCKVCIIHFYRSKLALHFTYIYVHVSCFVVVILNFSSKNSLTVARCVFIFEELIFHISLFIGLHLLLLSRTPIKNIENYFEYLFNNLFLECGVMILYCFCALILNRLFSMCVSYLLICSFYVINDFLRILCQCLCGVKLMIC